MQGGHDPARFIPRGDAAVRSQFRAVLHHRTQLPRPPLPSVRLRGAGGDSGIQCLAGPTERLWRLLTAAPLTCTCSIGIMKRAAKSGCNRSAPTGTPPIRAPKFSAAAYAIDDEPVQLVDAGRSRAGGVDRSCDLIRIGSWPRTMTPSRPRSSSMSCAALWLAADPARAAPLHHGDGAGGWTAGTVERRADALELVNRKDVAGERLMHQTSKPRRARKDEDPGRNILV